MTYLVPTGMDGRYQTGLLQSFPLAIRAYVFEKLMGAAFKPRADIGQTTQQCQVEVAYRNTSGNILSLRGTSQGRFGWARERIDRTGL